MVTSEVGTTPHLPPPPPLSTLHFASETPHSYQPVSALHAHRPLAWPRMSGT